MAGVSVSPVISIIPNARFTCRWFLVDYEDHIKKRPPIYIYLFKIGPSLSIAFRFFGVLFDFQYGGICYGFIFPRRRGVCLFVFNIFFFLSYSCSFSWKMSDTGMGLPSLPTTFPRPEHSGNVSVTIWYRNEVRLIIPKKKNKQRRQQFNSGFDPFQHKMKLEIIITCQQRLFFFFLFSLIRTLARIWGFSVVFLFYNFATISWGLKCRGLPVVTRNTAHYRPFQ